MSVKHPIVAITGSSGAGTSTVTKSVGVYRDKIIGISNGI